MQNVSSYPASFIGVHIAPTGEICIAAITESGAESKALIPGHSTQREKLSTVIAETLNDNPQRQPIVLNIEAISPDTSRPLMLLPTDTAALSDIALNSLSVALRHYA